MKPIAEILSISRENSFLVETYWSCNLPEAKTFVTRKQERRYVLLCFSDRISQNLKKYHIYGKLFVPKEKKYQ